MKLPFRADRELLAPARAAAGQDGTAVLGGHARPESVRFGALAVIRLKGAFRHLRSTI